MAAPTPYQRGTILGLRPGDIIDGRLQIGSLIGYGGQGVVLEVKHLEWGKSLALKLPLPEVVQSKVNRERFLKEAESWIRLGVHPNVVRCWFVQQISGLPGLFLDLVTGGSLDDKIKDKQFAGDNWDLIIKVLLQIAEGLTHSHSMGFVHRDIKPENILIYPDGTICLTDFGLVKSFYDPEQEPLESEPTTARASSVEVTGTGQFVGSPRYGAPEQWNKALVIGPTTDIYAVGVLFFEMLCGRRPFDAPGENPDPLTLIHRHLKDPPPDPRVFREDIPAPLAELCLHCLAKSSEYRPTSAEQMIELLATLLRDVCGETYKAPVPVPDGDRADLLNNAAVSLYSLGKRKESRELFNRGLLLQAGHPECLYNLMQLDRRDAKITGGESIRRIRRANAKYELALLCIEEGLGDQARALLAATPEQEKNGLLYRIEGDAMMYAKDYAGAQKAYSEAQRIMPFDVATTTRKQISLNQTNSYQGDIYFPESTSCFKDEITDPQLQLALSPNSERVVGVSDSYLVTMPCGKGPEATKTLRPQGSSEPQQMWWGPESLLIQDAMAVESWNLQAMALSFRREGRLLATTRDCLTLVILDSRGLWLMNLKTKQENAVIFHESMPISPDIRACFTSNDSGLCLLTSTGKIAQVDGHFRAIPLPWPPPLPRYKEVSSLKLSLAGLLHVMTKTGHVVAINFVEKKMNFTLKLPFAPKSMTLDSSGELTIVSSEIEFGVIKEDGKVLLRGEGPFAVDSTYRYGIRWCEGYLMLYQLAPFRRLRTWTEKISLPKDIQFSRNGRKAISVHESGEVFVWEVDEDHRVYERNLLLTEGESYDQLISSFEAYRQLLTQAQRFWEKKSYYYAYTSVKNARAQAGFLQAEKALELQWELCKKLKRDSLEAIWERLYADDVLSTSLSADGQSLVMAERQSWCIRQFGTLAGAKVLEAQSLTPIVLCRSLSAKDQKATVLFIHINGRMTLVNAQDGKEVLSQDLGLGLLSEAVNLPNEIFVRSAQNVAAFLQADTFTLSSSFDLKDIDSKRVYPLSNQRILSLTPQGPMVLDALKNKIAAGLPISVSEPLVEVTFAAEFEEHSLLTLGFADGTFVIGHSKGGKPLFTSKLEKGSVSGACVNIGMGLAAVVSSTGSLTLLDLTNGKILERFTAHNQSIESVDLSPDGRYLSTRTRKGQFRFWELSWTLLDESGSPKIDWLPSGALSKLGRLFKFG